jgi:hypothetical protein
LKRYKIKVTSFHLHRRLQPCEGVRGRVVDTFSLFLDAPSVLDLFSDFFNTEPVLATVESLAAP